MSIIISIFQRSKKPDFEELIKREHYRLYKIAFAYVKNEQDALDIVQETMIKGFKSFHKLNDSNRFQTWITRILINTSIDFIRKRKDVIYLEQEWFSSERNEESNSVMKMDLATVFEQLKPEQKTLLLLRFYYGYSIREIADIVERREGTIKSQLHRTLNQVKVKLGNGGETYGEFSSRF